MIKFYKAQLAESSEELLNPAIGWYHLYTWHIAPPYPEYYYVAQQEEKLVMHLIDISEFRSKMLCEEALCCIENILEYYSVNQKQMILRFVYDTQGKGILKEPSNIDFVKIHMRQIGERIKKYKDSVVCIQGIFVGNWGEMHGSRYLTDKSMAQLIKQLDEAVGNECFLAVRKPSQWRRVKEFDFIDDLLMKRIGIFNDGMFGSQTDLGTYSDNNRQWELEWQQEHMKNTYNGGEVLAGEELTGYREAAKDFSKMHISYLNSVYNKQLLEHWKSQKVQEDGCWKNISGYDYIGRHLGYRFVIHDVKLKKQKTLYIQIENVGFANLCKEAVCYLLIEDKCEKKEVIQINTDARFWNSGEIVTVEVNLENSQIIGKISGEYQISIGLYLKSNGEVIRFANYETSDSCCLGRVITRGSLKGGF